MRIVLDGSSLDGMAPCLDELELYAPGGGRTWPSAPAPWLSASSVITGYSAHAVEHLNDGLYGNACSWSPPAPPESGPTLPEPAEIGLVVLSRDRNGSFTDRCPRESRRSSSWMGQSGPRPWRPHFRAPGARRALICLPPPPLPGRAPQAVLDAPRVNEHGHANLALRRGSERLIGPG